MKKLVAIMLSALMVVSLAACSGNKAATETTAAAQTEAATTAAAKTEAAAPASDPVVIKVAMSYSETDTTAMHMVEYYDKVTAATNGAIQFEYHYNGELGSLTDYVEMIQQGAPLITNGSTGYFKDYVPDLGIINGPYLYKNWRQIISIQDTDWFKEQQAKLAKDGDIRIVTLFYTGDRHVASTKRIEKPEDLKGLKVRVPGDPIYDALWSSFGASPVQLPFTEVYQGLQQGIIDAAEAPLSTLYSFSLQEVAPYLTLTRHISCADTIFMNETVWQTISEENQKIFTEIMQEMVMAFGEKSEAQEAEWVEKFKAAGVEVIEVDTDAFKAIAQNAYGKLDFTPGLYEKIQEMLK